jgi:hypothetical protein
VPEESKALEQEQEPEQEPSPADAMKRSGISIEDLQSSAKRRKVRSSGSANNIQAFVGTSLSHTASHSTTQCFGPLAHSTAQHRR